MNEIDYLVGDSYIEKATVKQLNAGTLKPYSDLVCKFLDCLSLKIVKSDACKKYQDVIALGFWCRRSNIEKMKARYMLEHRRLGRGLAFHIAPSNVPVNAFYSLFLGLLSGCKNIVRVSSERTPQISIVAQCIDDLIQGEFQQLKTFIYIIGYPRTSRYTDYFSAKCMVRIIWGGDDTIRTISASAVNARCKDIKFADRYSLLVLNVADMLNATREELKRIAHNFYNDTFLMDQNACSSPHLIVWLGDVGMDGFEDAKKNFWEAVYEESLRYDFSEIKATDKYTMLCDAIMTNANVYHARRYGNRIYVCRIKQLSPDIEWLRGRYGLFYEYTSKAVGDVLSMLSAKTQTCICYGNIKENIAAEIIDKGLSCIDRIVPLGRSLDISEVWDGYNLINEMTRVISIE